MATTPDNNLRLDLPDVSADDNTWGTILNALVGELERSLTDTLNVSGLSSSDRTLVVDGLAGEEARKMVLNCTGTLSANIDIIAPNEPKVYIMKNATTGAFTLGIKTAGGATRNVPQGESMLVWCDGANGFFTINALISGVVALATNSLQLGGIVAANYAQKAVKNSWTNPQIVVANSRTLSSFVYTAISNTDGTIIIKQSEVTSNITMANPSGTPIDGQILVYIIEQSSSTPRSVTWGSKFIFPDNVNINLTQTSSKVDGFSFLYSLSLDRWMALGNALNFARS